MMTREYIEKDTVLFVALTCPTCDKPLCLAVKDPDKDHGNDGGLWLSCCQDTACPMIRHDHDLMKMIKKLEQLKKEAQGDGPLGILRQAILGKQEPNKE